MKRVVLLITIVAGLSIGSQAAADIYRYDGDDEVTTFTDSPRDKRYQLVMKEVQSRSSKGGKGK